MGKVLSRFLNGFPGTVSRQKDDVIVALKNVGSDPIKPGQPVFLKNTVTPGGVQGFISGTTTDAEFVGFAVRVPDKTPEIWGNSQDTAEWKNGEIVEVLVRGSCVVTCATSSAKIGQQLYIRKSDSALVTAAGVEGSTVILPDTFVREPRDSAGTVEIVITKRHMQ